MDKNDKWPIVVNFEKVSKARKREVLEGTKHFDHLIDSGLSDVQKFSLRAMMDLMLNAKISRIEYVMEGSKHLDRVKKIRKLFMSHRLEDHNTGYSEMKKFVDEFTNDMKVED